MSFGMLKVARDKPQYIVRCGCAGALDNVLPVSQTNSRFDDCFGRKPVCCTVPDAEDVTRQMKGHDLPPTVSQQFIASNGSAPDLIKVLGRLRFSKDFGTAPIFEFAAGDSVAGKLIQPT
jgi:hypothetical protein